MSLLVEIHKRLQKFSLDIKTEFADGVTAVIGPSGCGKSMLLRCIAGIAMPDSGRILSDGQVWYDARTYLPPQRRRAGYLFQQYALFENKTVCANIMLGMSGTEQYKRHACSDLLERFHLTELAAHHPSQLSGGQKQRTALARMLAAKPKILLLDEPFSALDTHLRGQVRQQMADVLARHSGVALLVTHDFAEAVQLCSRAIVVSDGHIAEQGRCMDLWEHPQTRVCAELTGMRNFFPLPAGKPGCLGIRTEDFRPAREGDSVIFSGIVRHILPGIYTHQVAVDMPQGTLIWDVPRAEGVLPRIGAAVSLSADPSKIHVFKK